MAALRISDTEVAALKLEAWAEVESLLRHENAGPGGEGVRGGPRLPYNSSRSYIFDIRYRRHVTY